MTGFNVFYVFGYFWWLNSSKPQIFHFNRSWSFSVHAETFSVQSTNKVIVMNNAAIVDGQWSTLTRTFTLVAYYTTDVNTAKFTGILLHQKKIFLALFNIKMRRKNLNMFYQRSVIISRYLQQNCVPYWTCWLAKLLFASVQSTLLNFIVVDFFQKLVIHCKFSKQLPRK